MAKTRIEWTDYSFNPWRGCAKVSAGCDNCFGCRQAKRNPRLLGTWGSEGVRVVAPDDYWLQAAKWNAEAAEAGMRRKVFVGSMMDAFESFEGDLVDTTGASLYRQGTTLEDVRRRLFDWIYQLKSLEWLVLTKRPENALRWIGGTSGAGLAEWAHHFPHVWLGVSCENQAAGDRRIPLLLQIPAAVRFLSCEPLLRPIDLQNVTVPTDQDRLNHTGMYPSKFNALTTEYDDEHYHQPPGKIDWVIAGGESGPHARPCHPDWVRSIRDQCQAAGAPFFFKGWGEWLPVGQQDPRKPWLPDSQTLETDGEIFLRVTKKHSGRMLDRREWNEMPTGSQNGST